MSAPDVTHAANLEQAKSLTRNTLALHANTVLTSLLGFVFVVLAARLYDLEPMGRDMALLSTMTMLAAIAETNAGMALVRFLPRLGDRSKKAIAQALGITSGIAFVLATGFVLIAPNVSDSLSYITDTKGMAVLFVATVLCWNVFMVCDSILIAVRAATWILVKNVTYSVAKLVLMIAFAYSSISHGIFLAWAIPVLVMMPITLWLIIRYPLQRHVQVLKSESAPEEVTQIPTGRKLIKYLGWDSLAAMLSQIGISAMPLVVIITLGSASNAEFAVAFAIVTAVEQFAVNAGVALTAEGAFDERAFARLLRHSFVRFGGLLSAMVLIGVVFAPIATFAYGDQYGSDTTTVLRLLLIGLIPEAIAVLYEAIARVRVQAHRVVAVNGVQAVITLTLAAVLAEPFGLEGIGWAWIIGHSVVALAVLPSMLRMMFPRTTA